jgi:hypothetical protein
MNRKTTSLSLVSALLGLLVVAAGSGASAKSLPGPTGPASYKFWGIPRSEVEVDKGKFGNIRWTVRMRATHHRRGICIWLGVAGPTGVDSGRTCRNDLTPPTDDWLPVLGDSVEVGKPYTATLDFTSTRVRSVKLLIGPKPLIQRRVKTEIPTRSEARRAHLSRDFRFYVIHRRAELCVKHVTAFDQAGMQIDDFRTPCEI